MQNQFVWWAHTHTHTWPTKTALEPSGSRQRELLLTWNTRSELLWEFWDQIVVDPVLHGSQDDDGSGVADCRRITHTRSYFLCRLTWTSEVNTWRPFLLSCRSTASYDRITSSWLPDWEKPVHPPIKPAASWCSGAGTAHAGSYGWKGPSRECINASHLLLIFKCRIKADYGIILSVNVFSIDFRILHTALMDIRVNTTEQTKEESPDDDDDPARVGGGGGSILLRSRGAHVRRGRTATWIRRQTIRSTQAERIKTKSTRRAQGRAMQTGRMQSFSICQQAAEKPGSNNSSGSSTVVCFMVSATRLPTGPTSPSSNRENTHVKTRPSPTNIVHHSNITVEI